ncbi:MAG: hypothetical protein BLITH_0299 [Brockia lithotrophica]|uniref:Uncharacterized protein n=1 Tax=Brockia lithotrophica TaxID=933949 RepID=A0A2T5GAK2_9BACL|nr:MAG: hypothetical protein BLITH_0299 [Brockia lithotrophica]
MRPRERLPRVCGCPARPRVQVGARLSRACGCPLHYSEEEGKIKNDLRLSRPAARSREVS